MTYTREDDRRIIENQAGWPYWPALPIKRRNGNNFPECATLFPTRIDSRFALVRVSIWDSRAWKKWAKDRKQEILTVDELLDQGWTVD